MNNYGAYDDFNSETKITWYLAGLYQTSFENYTSPTSQYLGLYTSYAQDFNEFTDEMWGITSTSRIDPSTQYSTIDDIKHRQMHPAVKVTTPCLPVISARH